MVTNHGRKRLKERAGIKKASAEKNAEIALTEGVTHKETKGSLHRYIEYIYYQNRAANNIRVHNYYVYVFTEDRLITVLRLPTKYRRAYEKAKSKRTAGGTT